VGGEGAVLRAVAAAQDLRQEEGGEGEQEARGKARKERRSGEETEESCEPEAESRKSEGKS
jgi:hypothetical protein